MSDEIQAVLEELEKHRQLNMKYGPAVVQAAVIVELRKLRALIESAVPVEQKCRGQPKNEAPESQR